MARHKRLTFLAILAATLVGCGGQVTPGYDSTYAGGTGLGGSAPYPVASSDPYNSTTYPTPGNPPASEAPTPVPVASQAPSSSPTPTATDSTTPSSTDSASPMPSFPPATGDGLRIIDVQPTEKLGWCTWYPCFKAEITSVSVQNPLLNITQSGQLILTFLSNGTPVGQPLTQTISLPPAAIEVFGPFEATGKSDTANAQVTTNGQ